VNAGQYRALAVLSNERQPLMRTCPPSRNWAIPTSSVKTWYAVFTPVGTPKPIVDKLNAALRKITTSAASWKPWRKIGNEPKSSTPGRAARHHHAAEQVWGELIKRLNIKAE